MKISYSRANLYEQCPYRHKLRYTDDLATLEDYDPASPLITGKSIHKGIETDVETAIEEYIGSYPIIGDLHIHEIMKMESMIPKVKELINNWEKVEFEVKIEDDHFIGYIDLVVYNEDGTVNLYDFKYSNNWERYAESGQLSIYQYMYEKIIGKQVKSLGYIMIDKTMIRQKKTEPLYRFRERLKGTLNGMGSRIIEVEYDQKKVDEYFRTTGKIEVDTTSEKHESKLCGWCEFKKYCMEGENYMLLPKNERREIGIPKKRKLWIYGGAFSGKTTMLDDAPDPLNLNTDGNIEFVSMQYLPIKDEVSENGRIKERTLAWENFKNILTELELKNNDFRTIIIDLVEDLYESCRLYVYDREGITHESDDSFRAWDKVTTEFLSTMRKFFNLDYENLVIVSHEDATKDITKRSGDKITSIKPNIREKIAYKLEGMVDIVARVVVEENDDRTLNFKSDEVIFGGGRLKDIEETTIPLEWESLMEVYGEIEEEKPKTKRKPKKQEEPVEEVEEETEETEEVEEEKPKRGRPRKQPVEEEEEEKPKRGRSKKEPEEEVEEPVKRPRTRRTRRS